MKALNLKHLEKVNGGLHILHIHWGKCPVGFTTGGPFEGLGPAFGGGSIVGLIGNALLGGACIPNLPA